MKDYKKPLAGITPTKIGRNLVVTSIIFSKNRPLQLDLTLNSIKRNFTQCDRIFVIYACDTAFEVAYGKLMMDHPEVIWRKQEEKVYTLFQNIKVAVSEKDCKNDFMCFFTDDCIVYRKVDCIETPLRAMSDNEQINSISLRLGLNIRIREHEGQKFNDVPNPPVYNLDGSNWILWSFLNNFFSSYWCYPMSVDGHIYRRKMMEEIMEELCHLQQIKNWRHTPNEFESVIQRFVLSYGSLMIAPTNSCVVNSPNNRVQNSHDQNRSGDTYSYDADSLLQNFIRGYRINLDKLKISDIQCPHTELDLMRGLE